MIRPDQPLDNGARVENFEIDRVIGRGGFGVTYLATESARSEDQARGSEFQRQVAIKEYFPTGLACRIEGAKVIPAQTEGADTAYFNGLRGFIREANTIAQLDHQNIVRIHSAFESNGTAYFAMPYLEGVTLKARIWREKQLTQSDIEQLILPVMEGLEEAHALGIVHRDIKPENIVIRNGNNRPVLIDFGAARAAAADDAKQYTRMSEFVAYTPGYAPFEQYSRATSDNRHELQVDVYAICATLYACITGKAPVESSVRTQQKLSRRPDPMIPATQVKTPRGPYSPALLSAIDWGLQLIAEDRPASIAALRDAMLGRISIPSPPVEVEATHRYSAAQPDSAQAESDAYTQDRSAIGPSETVLHDLPQIGGGDPATKFDPYRGEDMGQASAPDTSRSSEKPESRGGYLFPFMIVIAITAVIALVIWPEMQTSASQHADSALVAIGNWLENILGPQ